MELPKEDIIRAYEREGSIRKVASEFGVTYQTVRVRLLKWGIKLRPMGRNSLAREEVPEDNPGNVEGVRLRILQLEEDVFDKHESIAKVEAELKEVQEEAPQEAATIVAGLKKADVELHDLEEELTKLRKDGMR